MQSAVFVLSDQRYEPTRILFIHPRFHCFNRPATFFEAMPSGELPAEREKRKAVERQRQLTLKRKLKLEAIARFFPDFPGLKRWIEEVENNADTSNKVARTPSHSGTFVDTSGERRLDRVEVISLESEGE